MSASSITFVDAVASGLRRTLDFRGRSTRAEFWYWVLFAVLVRLITATVDGFLYPEDLTTTISGTDLNQAMSVLTTQIQHSLVSSTFIAELLLLPSTISVTMRRLRDAGWKPWIAVAAYAVNYAGLVVTLAMSSVILGVLTSAGDPISDADAVTLLAPTLTVLGVALVDAAAFITTLVGTLQRTRPADGN